jgi:hypothetical protein
MYVEAGGTRIEGSMFQILSNAMIETERNLMEESGVKNGFYCTVIEWFPKRTDE